MRTRLLPGLLLIVGVAALSPSVLPAQTRHVVRIADDSDENQPGYRPAAITVAGGDMVVFRVAGRKAHSISFERAMPAGARAALNAAMPDRVGDLAGPVIGAGEEYRFVVPVGLPQGRYRFFCLPHRAYDEAGWMEVR